MARFRFAIGLFAVVGMTTFVMGRSSPLMVILAAGDLDMRLELLAHQPWTLCTYWAVLPRDSFFQILLQIGVLSAILEPRFGPGRLAGLAALSILVLGILLSILVLGILHMAAGNGAMAGPIALPWAFAGAGMRAWAFERSSFRWWEQIVLAFMAVMAVAVLFQHPEAPGHLGLIAVGAAYAHWLATPIPSPVVAESAPSARADGTIATSARDDESS